MSNPTYLVQLGAGLYMDGDGTLHQGPIPAVPIYQASGGLLSIDASKIGKTFKDIGDALPNKSEGKKFDDFRTTLGRLGAPDNLINLLGAVGQVASAVGNVFVVVGVAMAAAKLLGLFKDGPSALELMVTARFDALEREVNALGQLINQKLLDPKKEQLNAAVAAIADYVAHRDSGTLTPAQVEGDWQFLSNSLSSDTMPAVLSLLDASTYEVLFDRDKYKTIWGLMSTRLFLLPGGVAPVPANLPPVNTVVFDHRLAVVLASHAALTMLGLIRSLSPEYRTTGDLRPQLRACADKLDTLAATMRNTVLARTIHTEADFSQPIDEEAVVHLPFVQPVLGVPCGLWQVGAMDLRSHDDQFFQGIYYLGGFIVPGPSSKRGNLDFHWKPPATLRRGDPLLRQTHADGTPKYNYFITNPAECAAAANQQAEQDYADLLLASGYLSLVQLVAALRHAACQPDISETVSASISLYRKPQVATEVTVHSGEILFAGDIEAQAQREPQKVQAWASCLTQVVPRVRPLHYRVLLRTLASALSPTLWTEPRYSSVQSSSYMNDPLYPNFQRLVLQTSYAAVLGEAVLAVGSSPKDAISHLAGQVELNAHTFDWWIPTGRHPRILDQTSMRVVQHKVFSASSSGSSGALPHIASGGVSGAITNLSEGALGWQVGWQDGLQFGWLDGTPDFVGEHRDMATASVQLNYRLDWSGDHLSVLIENRPQDRNYVVFLVIEETFGSVEPDEQPPKVLHSAFPIAINGQLTRVPRTFFDQEKAARDRVGAIMSDFARHYSVSRQPGHGDPVIDAMRPGEVNTPNGLLRLISAARQIEPGLLERAVLAHRGVF